MLQMAKSYNRPVYEVDSLWQNIQPLNRQSKLEPSEYDARFDSNKNSLKNTNTLFHTVMYICLVTEITNLALIISSI